MRFPRTHRLRKPDEFSSVLRFKCSVHSELLQIFAKPNGLAQPRLGLIVAGKIEPLSVRRNRTKRLLREAFRGRQQELGGLDVVMRLRSRSAQDDSSRIKAEADELMVQLQRCRKLS